MMKSSPVLTDSKIKKWAYRKSDQEQKIKLDKLETVVEHSDVLFSLVSDKDCPQRTYILHCLYSLVGKSVSQHSTSDTGLVDSLLTKAEHYQDPVILNWVSRSRTIMKDMRKYDYVEWCEGGFVNKDLR